MDVRSTGIIGRATHKLPEVGGAFDRYLHTLSSKFGVPPLLGRRAIAFQK